MSENQPTDNLDAYKRAIEIIDGVETVKITPQDLVRLFQSEKFLNALKIAARVTQSSGYETAFEAAMLEDQSFSIVEVRKGMTDAMRDSTAIKKIDGINLDKSVDLFQFHFHPEVSGPIWPSASDLRGQANRSSRKGGVYWSDIFLGVGQVDRGSNVRMLVVQSPLYSVTNIELEAYGQEEFSGPHAQADIQEALEGMGFTTAIMEFVNTRNKLILTPQSIEQFNSKLRPIDAAMVREE